MAGAIECWQSNERSPNVCPFRDPDVIEPQSQYRIPEAFDSDFKICDDISKSKWPTFWKGMEGYLALYWTG